MFLLFEFKVNFLYTLYKIRLRNYAGTKSLTLRRVVQYILSTDQSVYSISDHVADCSRTRRRWTATCWRRAASRCSTRSPRRTPRPPGSCSTARSLHRLTPVSSTLRTEIRLYLIHYNRTRALSKQNPRALFFSPPETKTCSAEDTI